MTKLWRWLGRRLLRRVVRRLRRRMTLDELYTRAVDHSFSRRKRLSAGKRLLFGAYENMMKGMVDDWKEDISKMDLFLKAFHESRSRVSELKKTDASDIEIVGAITSVMSAIVAEDQGEEKE